MNLERIRVPMVSLTKGSSQVVCVLSLTATAAAPSPTHLHPPAVRQKAKDITNLLLDERRMRDQRKNREHMRDRMQGDAPRPAQRQRAHTTGATGRDSDMEAAIAASKRSAEQEAAKGRRTQDEDDLERALRLSREEDERRKRELAAQNGGSLFDDQQSVAVGNEVDFARDEC